MSNRGGATRPPGGLPRIPNGMHLPSIGLPQQQSIQIQHMPGPLANPATFVINEGSKTTLLIVGGMSQRVQIAAQMMGNVDATETPTMRAKLCFELADAMLAEAAKPVGKVTAEIVMNPTDGPAPEMPTGPHEAIGGTPPDME